MSNDLEKLLKLNPRLDIHEIVTVDGDYAVVIGKMGEDDNPHYLITNIKYGVVEASTGALSEVDRLLGFCLGRKPIKQTTQDAPEQKDLWN